MSKRPDPFAENEPTTEVKGYAHPRNIPSRQHIEQGGFSHVGPPHQHDILPRFALIGQVFQTVYAL